MIPLLGEHLQDMKSVSQSKICHSATQSLRVGAAALSHGVARAPAWEVTGNPPLEACASVDKGLPQGWVVSPAAHSMS